MYGPSWHYRQLRELLQSEKALFQETVMKFEPVSSDIRRPILSFLQMSMRTTAKTFTRISLFSL
jgi:hypothetical protein